MYFEMFFVVLTACLLQNISAKTDIENLVGVVQVFRHGERTPTWFFANDIHANATHWPVPIGQLTNGGKNQHYALGKFSRERYDGFLPKKYDMTAFYVQTTDIDRTHMSAQTDVAGIFPPDGSDIWNPNLLWQPIPIHPVKENIFPTTPDCTPFYTEWAAILANPERYFPSSINYTELFEYLTNETGSPIYSIMNALLVHDALFIEELFGYDLPSWAQSVYPEPLRTVGGFAFLSSSYTDIMKKLTAGSFLYTVIENFEELWYNSSARAKYEIYSGHDMNIAAILNTLGAFQPHLPPFACSIYFELRNVSDEAVVNIWYKRMDKLERIVPKNCDFDCPLTTFKQVLSPWLINTDTWTKLCNSRPGSFAALYDPIFSKPKFEHVHNELIKAVTHLMDGKRPLNALGTF